MSVCATDPLTRGDRPALIRTLTASRPRFVWIRNHFSTAHCNRFVVGSFCASSPQQRRRTMRHVFPALLQSMAACWTSSRSIIRGFAGHHRRILTSTPESWHKKNNNNMILCGTGTWTRRTTTTTCCCFVPLLVVDAPIHAHPRQQRQRRWPRLDSFHPSSCYSHWTTTVGAVHRNPTRPTLV